MSMHSIIAEALLQPPLFMFIYVSNITVKILLTNFKYLVTYFNSEKTAIQSNDNKVKCISNKKSLFGIKF